MASSAVQIKWVTLSSPERSRTYHFADGQIGLA